MSPKAKRNKPPRLDEENKETDESIIVIDGHTESYDDDRQELEAPTTMGLTGGPAPAQRTTRTRKEEGNHQVRRTYKVSIVGSSQWG